MKVIIDDSLKVSLFGQRTPKADSPRFYYQVVGYDCLVLVFHNDDYAARQGRIGVALFNFDQTNGRIICDLFPKAPARWRDEPHLIQVTVRRDHRQTRGGTRPLSAAVMKHLGPEC